MEYLKLANTVVVLKLDGWRESKGVKAEIAYAARHGIPVAYMEAD